MNFELHSKIKIVKIVVALIFKNALKSTKY